jgi:hypothetical protein
LRQKSEDENGNRHDDGGGYQDQVVQERAAPHAGEDAPLTDGVQHGSAGKVGAEITLQQTRGVLGVLHEERVVEVVVLS